MQLSFKRAVLTSFALLFATFASAQDRAKVVTVNYPLQYFADRLLGETAEVVYPIPQDVDPSFWRPSVADISMIQSADLILLNGAGFASWIDRVSLPRSRLVNTSAAISDQFIVTESITHSHGEGGTHSHEGLASYLWLDLMLAAAQADAIAKAASLRDLVLTDQVEARLEDLRADLEELDQKAQRAFAGTQGFAMIATHPRYQYLGLRYGLSIRSLEWEEGATPNNEQLAELQALVDQTDAKILIWEAEPSPEAFAAARDLGLKNVTFPTLVHQPADGDFLTAFENALSDFAKAMAN